MRLNYNGYNHADNEVGLHIVKQALYGPSGNRERERQIWTITGVLQGTSESDLTSKIDALETAYSTNGGDIVLYGNAGPATDHQMSSSGTINGVQVQSIQWLPGNPGIWGMGTEYVNVRSYRIILSADRPWYDTNLVYYQSTITATGTCGPKTFWVRSLTGVPQAQTVQAYTTQIVVQSGMNIGLMSHIAADGPLYPLYEQFDKRRLVTSTAQRLGTNTSTHYPTRWMYFFESPIPLVV